MLTIKVMQCIFTKVVYKIKMEEPLRQFIEEREKRVTIRCKPLKKIRGMCTFQVSSTFRLFKIDFFSRTSVLM